MGGDPDLDLHPLERRLFDAVSRRGLRGFVLVVTAVSVLLSEVITTVTLELVDTPTRERIVGVAIALVVPATVAPLMATAIGRLLQRLAAASAELRRLAETDPLTATANRRAFGERAGDVWNRRRDVVAVVAMVDVDDFKAVNDRLGHPTGDRVLTTLATRLLAAVASAAGTPGDGVVGRLGGDEFALVAVVPDRRAADELVASLRAACELGAVVPGITASAGFLVDDSASGGDLDLDLDLDEALARADVDLYAAKGQMGRRSTDRAPAHRS